jgi:hypothetical protein
MSYGKRILNPWVLWLTLLFSFLLAWATQSKEGNLYDPRTEAQRSYDRAWRYWMH